MTAIRLILNLLLALLAGYLSYQLYETIKEPIDFNNAKVERDAAVISKLKDIRRSQVTYKSLNGKFAASFDSLKLCMKNDSIEFIKIIGDPDDTTQVVERITTKIAIRDSIFKGNMQRIDSLSYLPSFAQRGKEFDLQAKMITKNEIEIPAFEASVPYEVLYDGLVEKYYADKVGEVMRVGSLKDGSVSGNWDDASDLKDKK